MERSESGQPIYQHQERERDFEFAIGDGENIEAISNHIEQYLGPVDGVLHEMISDLVHIDIHVVAPTEERDWYTLVTSGMSDKPMNAPEGAEEFRYSELMISLPSDWNMNQEDWKQEEHFWPIRWLKMLARFPHEYETWLWEYHSMPNQDPPQPFASNTEMCGMLIVPPLLVDDEFQILELEDRNIFFHALLPIYSDELDLKLKEGVEALFDGFDRDGVCELLNPKRPSILG